MNKAKSIGVVAVSPEGASICYLKICYLANEKIGAYRNPEIFMHHSSFYDILTAQNAGDWQKVGDILLSSIKILSKMGASFAIIPANSVHFTIERLNRESLIPILNILDAVTRECARKNYSKVGVLGVGLTMRNNLYKKPLEEKGISYIIPNEEDKQVLNSIIYDELVKGVVNPVSTKKIVEIIQKLKLQGCDAVVLACTELPMAINSKNSPIPVIDSTAVLAEAALDFAIQE